MSDIKRYDFDAYDKLIVLEESDGEYVRFEDHLQAIKQERQRIADSLFQLPGFMVSTSEESKYKVTISFPTMEEMHKFHRAFCDLATFKSDTNRP